MRFLKPIVSMFMALLIGVTSLGMAVSAHTCSEAGVAETSIGHIKACCIEIKGDGIHAEPCCKVHVQHVKLATVRHLGSNMELGKQLLGQMVTAILPTQLPLLDRVASIQQPIPPPDKPPLIARLDVQAQLCRFLI